MHAYIVCAFAVHVWALEFTHYTSVCEWSRREGDGERRNQLVHIAQKTACAVREKICSPHIATGTAANRLHIVLKCGRAFRLHKSLSN